MYINETGITNENIFNNYINASYISGPNHKDLFIACQAPLQSTTERFWNLIFNKKIKVIIMLANLYEEGRKKCDAYWPEENNQNNNYQNFDVHLENEFPILDKAVIQRNFIITNKLDGTILNCTQLHVICWPDHSYPEEEIGYKAIDLVISYIDDILNESLSHIIVHCR